MEAIRNGDVSGIEEIVQKRQMNYTEKGEGADFA